MVIHAQPQSILIWNFIFLKFQRAGEKQHSNNHVFLLIHRKKKIVSKFSKNIQEKKSARHQNPNTKRVTQKDNNEQFDFQWFYFIPVFRNA